ncbi:MAG: hypothetical protein IRZ09_12415 [Variibacter sp.]|nr:hypothetical protein [Variibacter sp.]
MTRRPERPQSTPRKLRPAPPTKEHLDALLDEALDQTFPASDPPAMLEPAPDAPTDDGGGRRR